MTKKILTGILVVSLVSMLACTALVMGVMYDYLGTSIDKELKNEADLVAAGLAQDGTEYLDRAESTGSLQSRITLITPTGEVLFDSMADEGKMENHLEREEIQEALTKGEGEAVRHSATMASNTRYYAVKLDDGNILRLSTDHYSHLGLIWDTLWVILIILAVLVLLGVVISRNITKHIIRPVNEININNPDIKEDYEELAPLLHRIHQQNSKITSQIDNLRRKQEEFNIIIENMSEGLLIIGKDLEILTYNKSALRILNAEDKKNVSKVFMLNRSEPFRSAVNDSLKGIHCRYQIVMGSDTYEILGNPVFNEGKVTGAILILMDVTEREIGEKLRREFTSNVSHELKTPLTSIYGVSDMLASGLVKAEDVNQFAVTIKEESARLISLIDDIIQLSRLDENYIKQEKEDVNLYLIAGDVVSRLAPKAKECGVELHLEGSDVEIKGVAYVLDEIVYNLCENAIKYNKENGKVTVSVSKEMGNCVLRVADTGIGIPKEDLERVFERFYRVDKSHCNQVPGTGLGLSIVKHGVAFHNGSIAMESSEGVGTTVTVKFNLENDPENQPDQ